MTLIDIISTLFDIISTLFDIISTLIDIISSCSREQHVSAMRNAGGCILCERCSSAPPTKPTQVGLSKPFALAAVALVTVAGMLLQLVRIARPCTAFHVVPNEPPAPPTPCARR